jgi:hypothetical protein
VWEGRVLDLERNSQLENVCEQDRKEMPGIVSLVYGRFRVIQHSPLLFFFLRFDRDLTIA